MNIRRLTIVLANFYDDTHEIEPGLFKIAYRTADGEEVWTLDDSRVTYFAHKQLEELDKKRREITKQLILDALKNKTKN